MRTPLRRRLAPFAMLVAVCCCVVNNGVVMGKPMTITTTNPNLDIRDAVEAPDIPSVLTDEIMVTGYGTIVDLDVGVTITHDNIGDLDITISKDDTTVVLKLPGLDSDDNRDSMNVVFDSDAAATLTDVFKDAETPVKGTFRPVGDLAEFNGMKVGGNWTITVKATSPSDTGKLDTWRLIVDAPPLTTPPVDFLTPLTSIGAAVLTVVGLVSLVGFLALIFVGAAE